MAGFNGLLLHLCKRQVYCQNSDLDKYDVAIFGFYDGLQIKEVKDWYSFSPNVIYNERTKFPAQKEEGGDDFAERFSIKLLYPEKDVRQHLCECCGCDYEGWVPGDGESAEEAYPLFTVLLLNAAEQYVKEHRSYNDHIIAVGKGFQKALKLCGGAVALKYAVFTSIGYYDYVVLCKSTRLASIYRVVASLREGEDIVSSAYLLPGIATREDTVGAEKILENLPEDEKIKAFLRLNIREGLSAEDFLCELDENADKCGRKIRNFRSNIHGYLLGGNVECGVFFDDIPAKIFFREYLAGGLLTPSADENGLFSKYIAGIRTTIQYRYDHFTASEREKEPKETAQTKTTTDKGGRNEKAIQLIQEILNKYRAYCQEKKYHTRHITALEQVVRLYANLTHSSHTFDIQHFMIPVWDMLGKNILTVMEESEWILKNSAPEAEARHSGGFGEKTADAGENYWKIFRMRDTIDLFQQTLAEFLKSLTFTDRFFLEQMRLTHPAVGTATKLLYFYNEIICQVVLAAKAAAKKAEDSDQFPRRDYVFLVIAGGIDETEAVNYSEYLPFLCHDRLGTPVIVEERLIVVRLTERALYDTRGTLIRSVHEASHYIGERCRRGRMRYVIEALSIQYSFMLTELMLTMNDFFDTLKGWEFNALGKKEQQEWDCFMNSWKKAWMARLQGEWQKLIFQEIESEIKTIPDSGGVFFPYGHYFFPELEYIIRRIFTKASDDIAGYGLDGDYGHTQKESASAPGINFGLIYFQIRTEVMKDLMHAAAKRGMEYTAQIIESVIYQAIEAGEALKSGMWKALNNNFMRVLSQCFRFLAGLPSGYTKNEKYWEASASAFFAKADYRFAMNTLRPALDEAFSDYMTWQILKPDFDEYIKSFLYENWFIDTAMPMDKPAHYLRIGLILELCYLKTDERAESSPDLELEKKLKSLSISPGDLNRNTASEKEADVSEIAERIRQIWREYKVLDTWGVTEPLKEYLRGCGEKNRELYASSAIRNVERTYSRIQNGIKNGDAESVIKTIMEWWVSLAGSETGE